MAIMEDKYYQHPVEKWSAEKCTKECKRLCKDGLGTPYPSKGMLPHIKSGKVRYNGGIVIKDDWWKGEERYMPELAKGYKWVYIPTWCWKIIKEE